MHDPAITAFGSAFRHMWALTCTSRRLDRERQITRLLAPEIDVVGRGAELACEI